MGDAQWKLFNIVRDPGETTDLSADQPNVLADLTAEYAAYAEANGVLEMPEGYSSSEAVLNNATARFYKHNRHVLIILGIVVLVLLYLLYRVIRAVFRRLSA